MGTTKQLPQAEWKDYFDRFTREHLRDASPGAATIELMSPTLGDQFEVSTVRLLGLTYDPKSRALEVLLENIDHLIFYPKEIWVLEGEPGFVATLEVIHSDGIKEIIYIRRSGAAARAPLPGSPTQSGGKQRPAGDNRR
jgi:uncharacterized protein DUF5335